MTTSSCSGRVAVFESNDSEAVKGGNWLLAKHATATKEEVWEAITSASGETSFLHEPFVLHCECVDIPTAQRILRAAVAVGFKESGLSLAKRVIVAVRTTAMRLEIPIRSKAGDLLVDQTYVDHIVDLANEKFEANYQRTQAFFSHYQSECRPDPASSQWCLIVGKARCKVVKVEMKGMSWLDK